ncbi:MAG: hypothetical protein NVS1B13_10400 [Flavisolibacter sp.]
MNAVCSPENKLEALTGLHVTPAKSFVQEFDHNLKGPRAYVFWKKDNILQIPE